MCEGAPRGVINITYLQRRILTKFIIPDWLNRYDNLYI